ncbi:NAD(P)-binding domain-containing protein [Sandaracinus amylolyticus]|nr:NAD(P)-binding domain-containing protein [Sandaracinus amylolyticus]
MSTPIGVIGGGGFGVGLARAIARNGRTATLWSRRDGEVGERIEPTRDIAALGRCELIFVSVPSMHVAKVAEQLGRHLDGRHLLVHVSRGLVGEELRTVSRVLRELTPARRVGCLAGPISAKSIAEGVPGGGIVGTGFPEVADALREAIAGPTLRLYQTEDVVGVEVSAALVGLLALAIGYAQEMGINPAALAILATRGMVETARIGVSLGADDRTFAGVAGYGDLIAAVAGDERPELELGRALGRGLTLQQAGEHAGAYIEGVTIARRVQRHAMRRGIEVPIIEALADALDGKLTPTGVIERLMSRRSKRE